MESIDSEVLYQFFLSEDKHAFISENFVKGSREYAAMLSSVDIDSKELSEWCLMNEKTDLARAVEMRRLLSGPSMIKLSRKLESSFQLDFVTPKPQEVQQQQDLHSDADHHHSKNSEEMEESLSAEAILSNIFALKQSEFVKSLSHKSVASLLQSSPDDFLFNLFSSHINEFSRMDIVALTGTLLESNLCRSKNLFDQILLTSSKFLCLDDLIALKDKKISQINNSLPFISELLKRCTSSQDIEFDNYARSQYFKDILNVLSTLQSAGTSDIIVNDVKVVILYHMLVDIDRQDPSLFSVDPASSTLIEFITTSRNWLAPWVIKETNVSNRSIGNMNLLYNSLLVSVPSPQDQVQLVKKAVSEDILESFRKNIVSKYSSILSPSFFAQLHAEVALTRGDLKLRAEIEKFTNDLGGPDAVKALMGKRELKLCAHNPSLYNPSDDVSISFVCKNLKEVLISTYEISTNTYYSGKLDEIQADLNLDGMEPHETIVWKSPLNENGVLDSLHQHEVTIPIPSLKNLRGVFIIELVSVDISCRALIRKGYVKYSERITVAGHALTLMYEDNTLVPPSHASVKLEGTTYIPTIDENDACEILIPFSIDSKSVPLILNGVETREGNDRWVFSSLIPSFQRYSEAYSLNAAFFVDREMLLPNNNATVIIQPRLSLTNSQQNTVASLDLLQNIALTVKTIYGNDRSEMIKSFHHLKITENQDMSFSFTVPPNLLEVSFTLTAEVLIVASRTMKSLSATKTIALNGMDERENESQGLHLVYDQTNGFQLLLLGRTGESIPQASISFSLLSMWSRERDVQTLVTDSQGRITLGELKDVSGIEVTSYPVSGNEVESSTHFDLPRESNSFPSVLHVSVGGDDDGIQAYIPNPSSIASEIPFGASLVQSRQFRGSFIPFKDYTSALKVDTNSRRIIISGLVQGDYLLTLPYASQRWDEPKPVSITVRVFDTDKAIHSPNFIHSKNKSFELVDENPFFIPSLKISNIVIENEKVVLKMHKMKSIPRVHVIISSTITTSNLADSFIQGSHSLMEKTWNPIKSKYLNARTLSDEQSYIINRGNLLASNKVYPGVMLPRPSLILDPWSIGTTSTSTQVGKHGSEYEASHDSFAAMASPPSHDELFKSNESGSLHSEEINLDFLDRSSTLLMNLPVDSNSNCVSFSISELKNRQFAWISAIAISDVGEISTCYTSYLLENGKNVIKSRDFTSLSSTLDASLHYVKESKISLLQSRNDSVKISGGVFSKVAVFNTLDKAHSLLVSISGKKELQTELKWIIEWPLYDLSTKHSVVSKFASNELFLFLFCHDRDYFVKFIKPYISMKRSMSFIERFLLGLDLKMYLLPVAYEKLNALEKALLNGYLNTESPLIHFVEANPSSADFMLKTFRACLNVDVLSESDHSVNTESLVREIISFDDESSSRRESMRSESTKSHPMPAPPMMAAAMFAPTMMRQSMPAGGGARNRMLQKSVDVSRRMNQIQNTSYIPLEKTEEFAETHYYHVKLKDITPSLIDPNEFWSDLALYMSKSYQQLDMLDTDGTCPFVSKNIGLVGKQSLSAILAALAVTGLPWESKAASPLISTSSHVLEYQLPTSYTYPMVLYHEGVTTADAPTENSGVLCVQNYFDPANRYLQIKGSEVEDFLPIRNGQVNMKTGYVYTASVILTNTKQSPIDVTLVTAIPNGALNVDSCPPLTSNVFTLDAFSSARHDYSFYFPNTIKDTTLHLPAHVLCSNELVSCSQRVSIHFQNNVESLSNEGEGMSWATIAKKSDASYVLSHVSSSNLYELELDKILWRCMDFDFWVKLIKILLDRVFFHQKVYAYIIYHGKTVDSFDLTLMAAMKAYLSYRQDDMSKLVGQLPLFSSDLFNHSFEYGVENGGIGSNDDVIGAYEHLEYNPLVNARSHQFGSSRKILNSSVSKQYRSLLLMLVSKKSANVTSDDILALVYHLLLQDRIPEARDLFSRVPSPEESVSKKFGKTHSSLINTPMISCKISSSSIIQYDYLAAYLSFYYLEDSSNFSFAIDVANTYKTYPISKWSQRFQEMYRHLSEVSLVPPVEFPIENIPSNGFVSKSITRDQLMSTAVSKHPMMNLSISTSVNGTSELMIQTSNIVKSGALVCVQLFRINIEYAFSSNPFVVGKSGNASSFGFVRPSKVYSIPVAGGDATTSLKLGLDESFNCMVEVSIPGTSLCEVKPLLSNKMNVSVYKQYGQLQVSSMLEGKKFISKAYVKVYSKSKSTSNVSFFKDGYTDLRGFFDYASLSTDQLSQSQSLAILVTHPNFGSFIDVVEPPSA
jgi:hypothetical protein